MEHTEQNSYHSKSGVLSARKKEKNGASFGALCAPGPLVCVCVCASNFPHQRASARIEKRTNEKTTLSHT